MLHELQASYTEEGLKAPIAVRPRITVLVRARNISEVKSVKLYTLSGQYWVTDGFRAFWNVVL
jgi:hypothetical protein